MGGEEKEYAMDVDIVSGLPIDPGTKALNPDLVTRMENNKARGEQLKASLASETGQTVLNLIRSRLSARINALIEQDGECRALKKLLVDMGVTINLGERAAERLIKMVMNG